MNGRWLITCVVQIEFKADKEGGEMVHIGDVGEIKVIVKLTNIVASTVKRPPGWG